ncbi:MAG: DUF2202 domain-containing protein [Chloroflexota bacterium]|nr:DUF2202 domain-containing protein [Chloroflexota bacterium]
MKTIKTLAFSFFAGLLALTIVTVGAPVVAEASANIGPDDTSIYLPAVGSTTSSNLTGDEADGLQFMVEEEKLARDVYLTLYEEWNFRIFQNIARAEQTHMDAIRTLLDRYNVEDPTIGSEIGEFTNLDLQELYDSLVDLGSESLADALAVGGDIEEIDIFDLEEYIEATDRADIIQVYERLLWGSENHLRAFVPAWERETGETYVPEYLSQERFDEIMSGSQGYGNSGGGRGKGGGRGDAQGGGHPGSGRKRASN